MQFFECYYQVFNWLTATCVNYISSTQINDAKKNLSQDVLFNGLWISATASFRVKDTKSLI